ncbi:MAG: hypothetical protein K1Y36_20535 [Blastocatellia bacterium]|nr:hypothetical protein [Blastocatellia bacterium]
MVSFARTYQKLYFMACVCILVGLWGTPATARQKANAQKKAPANQEAPAQAPPQNLPPGIQEMMKTIPGQATGSTPAAAPEATSQPASGDLPPGIREMMGIAPTPEAPKTGTKPAPNPRSGKALGNEDFGAPPADEVRERLAKKYEEQYAADEASWRQALMSARQELEAARAEQNNPTKPAPAAEGGPGGQPSKAVDAPPQPLKTQDGNAPPATGAPTPGQAPATAQTTTPGATPPGGTPPGGTAPVPPVAEKKLDPVRAAQEKIDNLLRIGRERRYRETAPEPSAAPAAPAPAPDSKKPAPPK